MAQGTRPASGRFRLSAGAQKKLNNYLAEIRKGISLVCKMHTYDSAPSMKKGEFEEVYIDKLLGMTATAVRLNIKAMAEGLTAQREKEAQETMQATAEKKEDKQ